MEKYRTWSIIKPTPELVCVTTVLILCAYCLLLAVHVNAVVQLLAIHPDAFESLFTIGLAEVDRHLHTLGLDELYFGGHLNKVFFGLDSFFILDH